MSGGVLRTGIPAGFSCALPVSCRAPAGAVRTVALMHESTTRGLGSAPGQVPANKGRRYRAEVLSRAEAGALIAACPAAWRTGIATGP